jgi:hypothetical protein
VVAGETYAFSALIKSTLATTVACYVNINDTGTPGQADDIVVHTINPQGGIIEKCYYTAYKSGLMTIRFE